jgi:phosphoenolpyruvate carboxylase
VRQNSAFHEKALDQLLRTAGVLESGESFIDWSVEKKRELLDRELSSPRPFLSPGISAGPEADTVLACHRVLAEHRDSAWQRRPRFAHRFDDPPRGGSAHRVSAGSRGRAHGEWTPEGLRLPAARGALFETMGDLEAGPGIVESFLSHPGHANAACRRKATAASRCFR